MKKAEDVIYETFLPSDPCTGQCETASCQDAARKIHNVKNKARFDGLITRIPGSGTGSTSVVPKTVSVSIVTSKIKNADCSSYVYFGTPTKPNPDWGTSNTSDINFQIGEGTKLPGTVGYDIIVFKAIIEQLVLDPKGVFSFYKGMKKPKGGTTYVPTICFSVNLKDGTTTYWDVSTHYPGAEGPNIRAAAKKAVKKTVAKKAVTKKTAAKNTVVKKAAPKKVAKKSAAGSKAKKK